jgi:hypothetical protein
VNAIRVITQIPPVQQIPGARIVIVEGMAEEVARAEKLAAEIDRTKGDSADSSYAAPAEGSPKFLKNAL